tara:strand:- start:1071 stop:1265 length:195 start_codon:yes stop_codon:yes gene_type:complete
MAKRREIRVDETNVDQMLKSGFIKITTPEDTIEAKVLYFRNMGYNNNQIAALLNIQKSLVDGIK